jgi:hypothetical protein
MRYLQLGYRSESIDVTSSSWAATAPQMICGTYCDAASTITGALVGDTTESNWILAAGYSPLAFRSINTSSTTKSAIHVLYHT